MMFGNARFYSTPFWHIFPNQWCSEDVLYDSRWIGETVVVLFSWPLGSVKEHTWVQWWFQIGFFNPKVYWEGWKRVSRWRRLQTKPLFSKQLLSFHFPSLYISTQSSRAPSWPPPFGSPWAQLVNTRALRSVQAQPSETHLHTVLTADIKIIIILLFYLYIYMIF